MRKRGRAIGRENYTKRDSLSSQRSCFPSRKRERREEKEEEGRGEEGEEQEVERELNPSGDGNFHRRRERGWCTATKNFVA